MASAARISVVAAITLFAAGCSGGEPPSSLEVPAVVWPAGEPSGEFEGSPWVDAVRRAETLSSVAWNNLDYSDSALIDTWGYDTVLDVLYDEAQLRFVPGVYELSPPADWVLDWGPNPLVILDVADADDSGVVTACAVVARETTGDFAVAVREYLVRDVGDGRTEISYEDASSAPSESGIDECTPDLMPEAVFDPAPQFPEGPDVTLRPPADRSVYEELQAGDG